MKEPIAGERFAVRMIENELRERFWTTRWSLSADKPAGPKKLPARSSLSGVIPPISNEDQKLKNPDCESASTLSFESQTSFQFFFHTP